MAKMKKADYLKEAVKHIEISKHNVVPLVDAMGDMAFSARDLARAAKIYNLMLADKNCSVILTLAGSLFSAGLKKVVVDLVRNNMVDAIVSTGAVIVDQDFFEGLGFKHYKGTPHGIDDNDLRALHIDRIYDTFIDEDELRVCDDTTRRIADSLDPRPYSSREFIEEMGKYLSKHGKTKDSVVLAAYEKRVPVFVPAFSDCSAGFGMIAHQWNNPEKHMSLDSAKDFLELTKLKVEARDTGLLMIGGGVPKNFTQDTVVAADILGEEAPMHKYAVQVTVADVRDGALSSSTLKEACSWGKVETTSEQMVFSEATLALPLIAGYAYHKGVWKTRKARRYSDFLNKELAKIG
ncbi:MAG: deoxyhypusine synthase [Elusimicrobia bacterium GWA2_61_42]|nr:MAG: deoxyhypusine synthase [Elusimicrobia bacterium GWA2_61_42]OGR76309.1 MAG: deoxyhypusine synthase [Elusimicrobia bacterium GWC2_61_25]